MSRARPSIRTWLCAKYTARRVHRSPCRRPTLPTAPTYASRRGQTQVTVLSRLWLTRRRSETPAVLHVGSVLSETRAWRAATPARDGRTMQAVAQGRVGARLDCCGAGTRQGEHACADAAGGQSTKLRAHPAVECARVDCNHWRHWALTKSTVKGCRS